MIKFFLYLQLLALILNAQVNTEPLKKLALTPGNHHFISLGGTLNSGTSSYYSISNEYRFDYIPKEYNQMRHIFVTKYNYSKSETTEIKNNSFSHYRLIKNLSRLSSYELFFQNESNSFKELKRRLLLGLSKRKKHTLAHNLIITLGLGTMYELEKYSNQNSFSKEARMTNNLILSKEITDSFNINWVNYHQPKISNFTDFRVLSELELRNKISNSVTFSTVMKYDYDSNTPSEYKKSNLNISQKFKFKI